MSTTNASFEFVDDRWDETVAEELDPLDTLVYRSNLLGQSWRITNTGGGNTSSKLTETDPLTGEEVEVLWVKGSGGDLRTAERPNFASLYQEKLLALQDVYRAKEHTGLKSPAEDAMTKMYPHCTFDLNPRSPSIDTPLHSFIPYPHVDHTHPVACIAIATAERGEELTKEVYGEEVVWVDWMRPGFELGLKMQEICRAHPSARGVMLGGHGLINWAETQRECYRTSLELIEKAERFVDERDGGIDAFGGRRRASLDEDRREQVLIEILPWLRGRVSREKKFIGTVQTDAATREFVNSEEAERLAELGTSCPDHFIRTKIKPLYVDWDPEEEDLEALEEKLARGLEAYREDYRSYYERFTEPDGPAMRDPNPTVILIPGVGMIAWGKNKSESRATAEFYRAAIEVMRGAESIDTYTALPRKEAYDIEYWPLEIAKLKRRPPEEELAREIVAIVGAGSGIGEELVGRVIEEDATVAALDLDGEAARTTADAVLEEIGKGIGVAGSGISDCGDVIGLRCDATDRESVSDALDRVTLAYGGIDQLVVTAGLYVPPDTEGRIPDEEWERTFAVNVTGAHLLADEAARRWNRQGLEGAMVLTTSANAVVAKTGSMAYDTSKAAANHLVRELALELAPKIRVNGVAPASVVEGSNMFPRDRVIASLTKYEIDYDPNESTKALRQRLADYYSGRTLTGRTVSPEEVAEAIYLLLSSRLDRTTGHILPVDGGLRDAFLR